MRFHALSLVLVFVVVLTAGCKRTGEEEGDNSGSASTHEATETPTTGWRDSELEHDGAARSFLLYAPPHVRADTPIVVFAHGYGDNADNLKRSLPIQSWADEKGFLAVVPRALTNPADADGGKTSWSAGACCAFGDAGRDDIGFIEQVINSAREQSPANRGETYLIGFSNGGFLAESIACLRPDLVDGVSSVVGSSSESQTDCRSDSDVRVHRVAGASDRRIKIEGGETPLGTIRSYVADQDHWRNELNCSGTDGSNSGPATCIGSSCERGEMRFCLIAGLGHTWPREETHQFDAFDDAWEFWRAE